MNPFFDSSVTDGCPPSMYLNQSSLGLFDDPSALDCPPPTASPDVSSFPPTPSLSSIPSQLSVAGAELPPLQQLPPPPLMQEQQRHQSPFQSHSQQRLRPTSCASVSIASVGPGSASTSLPKLTSYLSSSHPSLSSHACSSSSSSSAASSSTSSFISSVQSTGGSLSFFGTRGSHHPTGHPSHGTLPHPLTQPYRPFPRQTFFHSPVNNFFQSPFPISNSSTTTTTSKAAMTTTSGDVAPPIDIIVSNVVAVCSVRCHLDLHSITMKCANVIFRRDRNVIIMKFRSPLVTCRVWSSGKITSTGAACEEDAKKGCRRVARILSRLGYKVRFRRFRVVNILASCVFPFAIKLIQFAKDHAKDAEYEPEIHPGVSLRFKELKVNMRVFSTGSVTVTAPKVKLIEEGVLKAFKMVYEYRNDEEDKGGLVPSMNLRRAMSIVPLLSQVRMRSYAKAVPMGPYHSRYKQGIHRECMLNEAIKQVRTVEQNHDFLFGDVYDSDSDFSD